MFIDLTEILRCPNDHPESYVICAPMAMDGRDVVRGGLLCPVCREEFAILDRIAWLGRPGEPVTGADASAPPSALTAGAALAFLDLQGPGGFVLTVGGAGRLASDLAAALPGVAVAAVNPPDDVLPGATLSVVRSPKALPVRHHMVRGVVVGADVTGGSWLAASAGALLNGLRLVVEDEHAEPAGIVDLARGSGVLVGEKRAR